MFRLLFIIYNGSVGKAFDYDYRYQTVPGIDTWQHQNFYKRFKSCKWDNGVRK